MPIHASDGTGNGGTSNAVVIERVDNLIGDVCDLKKTVDSYIKESRDREEKRDKESRERDEKRDREIIIIGHKVDTAHIRIDSLEKFKADVDKLLPFLRAYAWVLVALAVPVMIGIFYLAVDWIRSGTP